MSATSIDVADVITQVINDAVDNDTFNFQFTAIRAYVPPFVLEEATPKGLQVFVCPTTHGNVNLARDTNLNSCGIVVSVIKHIDEISNEVIDPLVELVEQLKDLLGGTVNASGQSGMCNLQDEPLYRPEILVERRVFWGMFTVTVQLPR